MNNKFLRCKQLVKKQIENLTFKSLVKFNIDKDIVPQRLRTDLNFEGMYFSLKLTLIPINESVLMNEYQFQVFELKNL